MEEYANATRSQAYIFEGGISEIEIGIPETGSLLAMLEPTTPDSSAPTKKAVKADE